MKKFSRHTSFEDLKAEKKNATPNRQAHEEFQKLIELISSSKFVNKELEKSQVRKKADD